MQTGSIAVAAALYLAATPGSFGQPVITTEPQSRTNLAGTPAMFSVAVTGTPPIAYQWFFNPAFALANETNSNLILTNVQAAVVNAGRCLRANPEIHQPPTHLRPTIRSVSWPKKERYSGRPGLSVEVS